MRTKELCLSPIGFVASPVVEQQDEDWGRTISRIELLPEYSGGLKGLEEFSHVLVVTYLHQAKFEKARHLQRRPRDLESMPCVGIFAQRAKDRPNPIGVTAVELVSAGDDYIEVRGLDAINDTPVLDTKPYFPQYDRVDSPTVPDRVNKLMESYF